MCMASRVIVLAILVLAGCGKKETGAEQVSPMKERSVGISAAHAAIMAAQTQVGLIDTAFQTYEATTNSYPPDLQALFTRPRKMPDPNKWSGPYLNDAIPNDPWGNPYHYVVGGPHNGPNSFDLWSSGPDGVSGTKDDIGNWRDP